MAAKGNPYLKKATGAGKAPASVPPSKKHGLGRGLDGLLGAKPVVPVAPVAPPAAAPGAPL